MSYQFTWEQAEDFFQHLRKDYQIYAPKRFKNQGRYSDTDIIRFDQTDSIYDIVWQQKSDFPAKEVFSPIQQTLFYFTEDEYRASKSTDKPILIFAFPCDIAAQDIQAKIYLQNGGYEDYYYERIRDRVKFVMMECNGGNDTCFCASMGTNKTENYTFACRFSKENILIYNRDESLAPYFHNGLQVHYKPEFVLENQVKVTLPDLSDFKVRQALKAHPIWKEFDSRCISCGSCTVACSTCTCFTVRDVIYSDNLQVGERRRTSASCQIAGFDQMAGQKEFRSSAGERMRYKMLHKFHDYKARFQVSHMCVGCGRCIHRCPEFISITATLDKMCQAVEEIKQSFDQGGACS